MNGNYIKISRSLLDWEWYQDINTCRLFVHMLLRANWKDGKFKGTTVPRGSLVSSIGKLSEETGLTVDEVRTAIKHLQGTGELTKQSTNKFTVYTVANYDMYQDISQATPNQTPSNAQAIPKLFPTIEEGKNSKKGRKEINNTVRFTPPDVETVRAYCIERNNHVDPQAFVDFYEAKGWMVGKNKMKNWKAAVRTWESNRRVSKAVVQEKARATGFSNFSERSYDMDCLERSLAE
ncbi:hypothetical protein [Dorea sp. D27]|uniref:hypothetical protein n=1 Tax=Dorea sp. D27 TaxID=658665 RepID=UPI0006A0960F|nr:hypothetical protein [Dorea sp. D27]KMZ52361.1 hypothetical protein HMPREF0980_03564 [Dorea sp. D27]